MHTSTGEHPDVADLVAYADGEAEASIAAHVRECGFCAAEADVVATTQTRLRTSLYRFDCPDALTLGEYSMELLDPANRQQVAAHLVDCDECRTEQRVLRDYLATDPPVPETLVGRVRRLVEGPQGGCVMVKPSMKIIPALATLAALTLLAACAFTKVETTGSPLKEPACRVEARALTTVVYWGSQWRPDTDDRTTHVYQVDGMTISIAAGAGSLIGLLVVEGVEASALAGNEVRLVPTHGALSVTTVDDLGNFELSGLVPGAYALEVNLPDAVVVIEELRVD